MEDVRKEIISKSLKIPYDIAQMAQIKSGDFCPLINDECKIQERVLSDK